MGNQSGKAQKQLVGLKNDLGSWRKVGQKLGVNAGLLCAIANGKKRAPRSVLVALGLCQPDCRTFDDWAAEYERWRAQSARQIETILGWALQQ